MPKVRNRVKETTLTAGSGNISLAGPVNGFQAFGNVLSSGDTTYYTIVNKSNWEVGQGTYAPNILSRDVVFSSSNSGQKINLSGKSDVFIAYPAEKSVFNNENDQTVVGLNGIVFADSSVQTSAYTDEKAQDAISSLLVAGTGIQLNYNDSGNALSIDAYGILPTGGSAGQILSKIDAANYNTEWIDNYAKEVVQIVKNSTHTTLSKGQVVYINGADGTNPTIALAIASGESTSSKTLGFLKQNLNHGDFGYVVTEGFLDGLNTDGATTEGDPIWLSPSVSGGVIYGLANKPYAPNHLVFLGYVIRKNINNGRIYVKIQNGFELSELHDVVAKTPNDGDIIRYVASSGLWSAQPMPVGYTDENAQDAVGGIVQNSSNVSLSYNDNTPSLIADLVDTTVASGVYGSANQVGTFTVDAKGRLTQASNVTITPSGIGALGSLNGLTGSTQTFATGTSGTDFNIVSAGTVHTFNLPDASLTARGLVTTATQRFAGLKYFDSGEIRFGTGVNDVNLYQSGNDFYVSSNRGRLMLYAANGNSSVNVQLWGDFVVLDPFITGYDTLRIGRGAVSQILQLHHTFTNSSNYERLALQFGTYSSARHAQIAAESAGTGTANINLVLTPKGTGALILGPPPDGTAVGGNVRGANAIDLQTNRIAATQVASGANSYVGPAGNGTASGLSSSCFGQSCVAAAQYSGIGGQISTSTGSGQAGFAWGQGLTISGYCATAFGHNSVSTAGASFASGRSANAHGTAMRAHASVFFSNRGLGEVAGSAQFVDWNLAASAIPGIANELFAVAGGGAAQVRITCRNNTLQTGMISIQAVRSDGVKCAYFVRKYGVKSINNVVSELFPIETIGTDLISGCSVAVTADNTNKHIKVTFTPPLGSISGIIGDQLTDVITANNHGLVNGQEIAFSSLDGGAGLVINQLYFVRDATVNTFKVTTAYPTNTATNFTTDITGGTVGYVWNVNAVFRMEEILRGAS